MKAQEVFDCIYTRPFAEDDYTLNDFIKNALRNVSWGLFERQEEFCHMISECNPPKLKDNAIDVMREEIRKEFSWIVDYMINYLLISYRLGNVDLGDEGEWYLRAGFNAEEWDNFNKAINAYIWEDYVKYLGVEEAKKHFEKINRPEYIMEDVNE